MNREATKRQTTQKPDRPKVVQIEWNRPSPWAARELLAAMDRHLATQATQEESRGEAAA